MVIVVCGLPGTGKTYFSKALAEYLGANYISSDEIRESLLLKGEYSEKAKDEVYAALVTKTNDGLLSHRDVIVDATFYLSRYRATFSQGIFPVLPKWIELVANEELCRSRVRLKRPHTEADELVYDSLKAQWQPINEPHLVLDSTIPSGEMILKAMQYLKP